MLPNQIRRVYWVTFPCFIKRSKHCMTNGRSSLLPLPSEATIEEKTKTCTDQRHGTYHWRHRLFKRIRIHASSQIIFSKSGEEKIGIFWMGRSHWDTDICLNFDWTLTPSLPKPVKFPGWKLHVHAFNFRSYNQSNFSTVRSMEILVRANAKKKNSLRVSNFTLLMVVVDWRHGSERVKLKTDMILVMQCAVNFELWRSCVALLVEQGTFPM